MNNKNVRLLSQMALKGHNLTTLSKETKICINTLSNKINGNSNFKELEMMLISKVLECKVTDIFFNIELPNEQQTEKEEAASNE